MNTAGGSTGSHLAIDRHPCRQPSCVPSRLTSGDRGLKCARCAVIGGLRIVIADEITVIGAFLRPNVRPTNGPRLGGTAAPPPVG